MNGKDEVLMFINFDKVAEYHSSDEGGTIITFALNGSSVHVKEDYDTIQNFMIKRMSNNERDRSLRIPQVSQ